MAGTGRVKRSAALGDQTSTVFDDNLSYLREFDHITLVRIRIAQYKHDSAELALQEALALLERLLQTAAANERKGSVLEILVLQALAHEAVGATAAALMPLEQALTLAEPEGYVRLFISEGEPLARLLSTAAAQGIRPDYTSKLLSALAARKAPSDNGSESSRPTAPSSQPLVEPLSNRELEVLQLVAQGLTNRQIAERLFIALPYCERTQSKYLQQTTS